MLSVVTRPPHGSSATLNSAQRRRAASRWQSSNAEKLPSVGNLPVLGFVTTLNPTSVITEPSNGTVTTVNHPQQHGPCYRDQQLSHHGSEPSPTAWIMQHEPAVRASSQQHESAAIGTECRNQHSGQQPFLAGCITACGGPWTTAAREAGVDVVDATAGGVPWTTAARFPDGTRTTMSGINESCITKPPVFSGLSASINDHVRLDRLGSEYQRFL